MNWFYKFMYGRYGFYCRFDALSAALLIFSFILTIIFAFIDIRWISLIIYIPVILCFLRLLSKNIPVRRKENELFLKYYKPVRNFFKLQYNRIRDRRTHRYLRCPDCKNVLRVPRGRGRIRVTCPVCHTSFDAKS